MRQLKRKAEYLVEAPQVKEAPIEPTVDELLAAIQEGKISVEELDQSHANGEISDETYQAVLDALQQQENEQAVADLVDAVNSGKITPEELDKSLANGEITEDVYTAVMQQLTDDPNMDAPAEEQPQEEPQPIVGTYNNVRLFDHFISLKEYISAYKSAYNDIEVDQLTKFQVDRLAKLYDNIRQLETDLIFYINNSFKNEDYKKNLYTYLLFNKQFADEIGKFRKILNLNPAALLSKDNDKDKKKS